MSELTDDAAGLTDDAAGKAGGRAAGGAWIGHVAMFAFAALVAASYSIGAVAAPLVDPAALNAMRFVIGTAMMGAALLALLGPRGFRFPQASWRFLVLGALMAVFMLTMFTALQFTGPVSTGAVFTLMPLMSAGFGWLFLGQVPRPAVVASLLLAGAGAVWVIFRGDLAALLAFDLGRGEAIFLIGCIAHAAYAPLVPRLNRGEPILSFTFYTLLATLLCVVVWGVGDIATTDWAALPAIVWIAIAYLAVFTTAGTFFLLQFASMRLPASKVMAYTYLTPSFIILYEGLVGHGWAGPSVAAGAGITVLGLILLVATPDA